MATKKRRNEESPELAITAFREALSEWERLPLGASLAMTAGTPDGGVLRVTYDLPDNRAMRAETASDYARFGLALVPWAGLAHPVLPPTDDEWRAAFDACSEARDRLAAAASELGRVLAGDGDEARYVRRAATALAESLRSAPWRWRTREELQASRELVRGIGEVRRAAADARRRAEVAAKLAAEAEHARQLREAQLRWIEWTKNLPARTGKREPVAIDARLDPTCQRIRAALAKEPLGLKLKELVARCGGEQHRTTIKTRIPLMHDVKRAAHGIYVLVRS